MPRDNRPALPPALPFDEAMARVGRWLDTATVAAIGAYDISKPAGWTYPARTKSEALALWVQDGSIELQVDDLKPVEAAAGDLWLFAQSTRLGLNCRNSAVRFATLHFQVTLLGGVDLLALFGAPLRAPRATSAYGRIAIECAEQFAEQKPGWKRIMEAQITLCVFNVLRECSNHVSQSIQSSCGNDLPRIMPALELIEKRLGDPALSVGDLARSVAVSEVYLRQLFKATVGTSPIGFIQKRRIEKAADLLRTTQDPIKEIALTCGFTDTAFFYRAFTRRMQLTPARYRAGAGFEF